MCPNCGSRLVGKIGARQFYCRSCYVEFSWRGVAWEVFEVDMDGELIPSLRDGLREGCREATA